MRFVIIFLLFVGISFGSEKKVVLGAYGNLNQAKSAIIKLKPKFSKAFQDELGSENALLKARKSGKMYIMVVEPLKDYSVAKKIKSLLPKPYNKNSLISNFSPSSNQNAFILSFQTPKEEVQKSIKSNPNVTEKPKAIEKIAEAEKPKEQLQKDTQQEEIKPLTQKQIEKKSEPNEVILTQDPETIEKVNQTRIKRGGEQFTYIDIILNSFKNIFDYFWNMIKDFYQIIHNFIIDNKFFLSLLILIVSTITVFIALKQKDDKAEELDILQKQLEEKAILVESIQIEMNHLKTYYNSFTNSVAQSMKILNKYFNQVEKEYTISPEALNAIESITTVLNSHEEFSGDILLDNVEFNLNQLVDSVVKFEKSKCGKDINLILDFDLPILERVMGDSARLGRIFLLLIDFMCIHTSYGRVIISLLEVSMNVDSVANIRVSIKGNKSGFDQETSKKIEQALLSSKFSQHKDLEIKKLVAVKRLLNIMNGDIKYSSVDGQESTFFFDFELKVMNRYSLKETSYFRDSVINLQTTVLGKSETFNKKLTQELSSFNIKPTTYIKWINLYKMQLQDTYSFMDLVIIDYDLLQSIDIETLFEQAVYKNFSLLIVSNDEEQNIKNIFDKSYLDNIEKVDIKVINSSYNLEELKEKLTSIQNKLKPMKLK